MLHSTKWFTLFPALALSTPGAWFLTQLRYNVSSNFSFSKSGGVSRTRNLCGTSSGPRSGQLSPQPSVLHLSLTNSLLSLMFTYSASPLSSSYLLFSICCVRFLSFLFLSSFFLSSSLVDFLVADFDVASRSIDVIVSLNQLSDHGKLCNNASQFMLTGFLLGAFLNVSLTFSSLSCCHFLLSRFLSSLCFFDLEGRSLLIFSSFGCFCAD